MNRPPVIKVLIAITILLAAITPFCLGCELEEEEKLPPGPYPSELSETIVPNVPLDIYLYAKQDDPTIISAELTNTTQDVNVESVAVWGVPAEDDFAFGTALTLATSREASQVYSRIKLEKDGWKQLSSNVIYIVYGLGPAAASLKTAISNNDFKYYDDSEAIESAGFLPNGGETKMAAVTVVKPTEELVNLLMADAAVEERDMVNLILKLVGLRIICGGLYSPDQIDAEEIANLASNGANFAEIDAGILLVIRSGLPGLLLEPAVDKILIEQEYTRITSGELTLYQGSLDTETGGPIHIMVRVEEHDIFMAASGQEDYAETLIRSVMPE